MRKTRGSESTIVGEGGNDSHNARCRISVIQYRVHLHVSNEAGGMALETRGRERVVYITSLHQGVYVAFPRRTRATRYKDTRIHPPLYYYCVFLCTVVQRRKTDTHAI